MSSCCEGIINAECNVCFPPIAVDDDTIEWQLALAKHRQYHIYLRSIGAITSADQDQLVLSDSITSANVGETIYRIARSEARNIERLLYPWIRHPRYYRLKVPINPTCLGAEFVSYLTPYIRKCFGTDLYASELINHVNVIDMFLKIKFYALLGGDVTKMLQQYVRVAVIEWFTVEYMNSARIQKVKRVLLERMNIKNNHVY